MNGTTELARETRPGSVKLTIPTVVFVVLMTWIASSLVTYGVISTRIEWLSQRVDTLEKSSSSFIPRTEYDARGADLAARLDRIERKIDAIPTK